MNINPLGDNAILIEFDQRIDPGVLEQVLALEKMLNNHLKGFKEIVPAYASLAVYYDPIETPYIELVNQINKIGQQRNKHNLYKQYLWNIPVCYDTSVAQDLDAFLTAKKISLDLLIELHTKNDYLIYMRGFLPGFLYLGGLDERLAHPRKVIPSPSVPNGSVAIGGEQSGIYSFPSPAGWHVIGRTPAKIFDKDDPEIMSLKPGDKVRFRPVSPKEYKKLVTSGDLVIEKQQVK